MFEKSPTSLTRNQETLKKIFPNIDDFYLKIFDKLAEKSQTIIISKLTEKAFKGPREEVPNYFHVLMENFFELEGMTSSESDKNHKPKPLPEEQKLQEEIEGHLIGDDS